MRYFCAFFFLALMLPLPGLSDSDKISKQGIVSQGKKRTYYLFVPSTVKSPAPLIITLHGSGRNGLSLVEKWKDLASKEGIIIAGPDSQNSQSWNTPEDGPDFLQELVEELKSKYPVNPRRVYLFGHSGGAVFALGISMFESKYFAATAIHAGAWREAQEFSLIDYAKRKIPVAIVVGDKDQFFPVASVKATGERLKEKGFDVEMTVMKGHTHWYYDAGPKINAQLWEFLKKYELGEEPEYERYQFQKQ
jgi:poly(3-hydroxybutyrate) depolymerase